MMYRTLVVIISTVVSLAVAPAAFAAWTSGGTASASAMATSVNQGSSPETTPYVDTTTDEGYVDLTWDSSTLANTVPVARYDVVRNSGGASTVVCEGVTDTSCTDRDPVPGPVMYAVVPRIGAYWQGEPSLGTSFQYDNLPPITEVTTRTPDATGGWNSSDVTVTLTATDPGPEASGVREIHYTLGGVEQTPVPGATATFTVNAEASTTVTFWAIDELGHSESPKSTDAIKIDRTAPVSTASLTGDSLTLSATDAGGSGLSKIEYRIGSAGSTYNTYGGTPLTVANGQTVYFHAVDVAGNVESPDHSVTYTATPTDTQKPVTSVGSSPVPNAAGWTTANTTLTLSSTDNMAVAKLEYRNGSGAFVTITGPGPYTLPVYTTEGTTTLEYRATDTNGNVEDLKTYAVKIDKTVPAAPASKPANGASFTNNNSGISSWEKACDGAPRVCATPAADTSGTGGVMFTLAATSGANTGKCWTGTVFQTATTCTALPMTRNQTTGQYESPAIAQALMLDGSYRLVLIVTDGAGLTTSTTINFAIT